MSTYSVPGDWFDSIPAPVDDTDYSADYYVDFDDDDDAELESLPRLDLISGHVAELRTVAQSLADKGEWAAAHKLRKMARNLEFARSELDAVVQLVTRPRPVSLPTEDSPTGNCRQCSAPLPLPTMKRGRPRTLCLTCSPPRR